MEQTPLFVSANAEAEVLQRLCLVLVTVPLLVTACQPIPAPLLTTVSPLQPTSAPPAQVTETDGSQGLEIERPVKAGDTVVRGLAPAGMTVILVDLTRMGIQLGQTKADHDGKFFLSVAPLEANVRIGVTTDSLSEGELYDKARQGPEPQNLPLVGYFMDTVLVAP